MSRGRVKKKKPNGNMMLFIDGSCNTKTKDGGFSVIVVNGKSIERNACLCIARGYKETTNNQMELIAYLRAIKHIHENSKGCKKAVIYSDSAYVVNGVNSWMYGWKLSNWKTSEGEPVKNVELWKKAYERTIKLQSELKLEVRKVKAHSGNPLNELADKMAKAQSGIELETEKEIEVVLN